MTTQSFPTPVPLQQAAYTFSQFAKLFNKNRSWAYRLEASGKIKSVAGYGCKLIPASEIIRITEGGAL